MPQRIPFTCAIKIDDAATDPRNVDILQAVSLTTNIATLLPVLEDRIRGQMQNDDIYICALYRANLSTEGGKEVRAARVDAFMSQPREEIEMIKDFQDYWSPDEIAQLQIHLVAIAKDLSEGRRRKRRSIAASDTVDVLSNFLRNAMTIRNDSQEKCRKIGPPSSAACTSTFRKMNYPPHLFNNLRSFGARGAPITLFHPVFGNFLSELHNTGLATPNIDFSTVHEFMKVTSVLFNTGHERELAIYPLLNELTGLKFELRKLDDGSHSDHMVTFDNLSATLIAQIKGDLGEGGCDASLQVAVRYVKCVGDRSFDEFRQKSCCPVILLIIVGPWMCIMGAIFQEKPVIEPLTDLIFSLDRPEDAGERVGMLARLFQALRNAHDHLCDYYMSLRAPENNLPRGAVFFPYRNSYDYEGSIFTFAYVAPIENEKLVWRATSQQNHGQLVVKFTKRYDIESHRLLADAGYAPRLYYADPPSSLAQWRMVVMEYIPSVYHGKTSKEERSSLREDLHAAVELLHLNGRVFGDLRLENVLIKRADDGTRLRAMLVDFDWSGKEGEARYPYDRNDVDIRWAEGSRPGGLIERGHDLQFLRDLDQGFLCILDM